MPIRHIFVYGTLLQGMDNYHLIEPYAKTITPGKVSGELYHLEYGYPALIAGNNPAAVHGEIIEINAMEHALPIIDRLEDYHGPNHPDNLYEREEWRAISHSGQEYEVYVYIWKAIDKLPVVGKPVAAGCWREYMAEHRRRLSLEATHD